MKYAASRFCENTNKIIFPGDWPFDIPIIQPEEYIPCEWVGFNYAKGLSTFARPNKGIHFFLDDYQFERLWREPDAFVPRLLSFNAVMSPDFSMFTDYPKAIQIYNHYRKHWLAAYIQSFGQIVYPTICWSDKESYERCFDGEPHNATVAVSSVGTQANKEAKKLFLDGFDAMKERLQPKTILFYGNVPQECTGNIVEIKPFQNKFRSKENYIDQD